MMTEKKSFDGPLINYDEDDYDTIIETQVVESKRELVEEVDLVKADARQLLLYFASRYKEIHGFDYVVDWVKDIAILKAFKERYGVDAGPMIRILFDQNKGKINDAVMTITAFSKGSKWIQDILHIEVQQNKIKEENKQSTEGLLNTDEFIKRFAI
jgi:uncharacterized lipoprotein YehR (DUF1307 family)